MIEAHFVLEGRLEVRLRVFLVLAVFLVSGCSVDQVRVEQQLAPLPDEGALYQLHSSASVKARNVRTVELRRDTHWRLLGSIEKGQVFEPIDQVVTVNGFNVHEAYIVVREGRVIGYYLPYEKSFVEAEPVKIDLAENGE